jgi:DNA-binding NarL/FixJ family response regulator
LEYNEPHNLALAVQCAFVGSVFICPQVKKQLSQYVFQSKLKQRQAVAELAEVDRRILALVAQGHTHNTIGKIVNYSALNVGYRLKVIVQTLNLQTKQEAIALANSIGLNRSLSEPAFQIA